MGIALVLALLSAPSPEAATVSGFGSPESWDFVGGKWVAVDGELQQDDPKTIAYAFGRDAVLSDPAVEVEFRVSPEGDGARAAGIVLCSTDSQSAYFVHFDTRAAQIIVHKGNLLDGANEVARVRGVALEPSRWHRAGAQVRDGKIRVTLDGETVLEAEDASHALGRIGVYASQGRVRYRVFEASGKAAELPEPWHRISPVGNVPKEQTMATILWTGAVCNQPGRYIGWPSIAQAANGDLIAVFSGDRTAHISPEGQCQMVRSTDDGATWSDAITIHNTPIDDRDAGIIRTAKDTVLVSWFTNPGGGPWQGHWVIRSEDHGVTWGAPIRTEVTSPHGPVQLSDGRILFVGQRPHESHSDKYDVGIQESTDDGRTWQTIGTFPVPEGARILSYDECHVVECASGKLLCCFRDCYAPHRMRQSESTDGGHTWSAPHLTEVVGYPPHVIRLKNNWLLAVYAKRWDPLGQYACISTDEGVTWDVAREIKLASAWDGDIGYPASVELDDGTIWTVFYQSPQHGAAPCLMGTHWRLKR
ncbi:MAG: DUF1080 domain-containing protein [bacterium]|nr:DUF1080 domain-containing protein [bacterium]